MILTTRAGALLTFTLIGAAAIGVTTTAGLRDEAPDARRTVVIAELFTSEGCSSCPPADNLLRRLIATQPVDGVEIVALGSHVDCWDRLGWRDPFSSPRFSERQSSYDAAVFRTNRIYTPQLVVDGHLECIGSSADAVHRTIRAAARRPKGTMSLSLRLAGDGHLHVNVAVRMPAAVTRRGAADVVVAVTEDGLVTRVRHGENGGRTLLHGAVVRVLHDVGTMTDEQETVSVTSAVPIVPDWKTANLRVVAFVQERASRRILAGAASVLQG